MTQLTRRKFIKATGIVAGAGLVSARSWAQVTGANSDVRVAVIGMHGRGRSHVSSLSKIEGVRIVAICDPDSEVLARSLELEDLKRSRVRSYRDVRELLDSSEIDAVTIAAPNHWHALAAIWACQSGKDVYVEKPVSHNVWEGRQLVIAADKYRRVVQSGTQIRSGAGLREAVEWVRAGNLGKITAARGFCYKRRESIGKTTGPQPIPPSVDYDLWIGPAPMVPPHRNSPKHGPIHYDWHWFYAYGNGDVGNQGLHQMDVARWFLGESGLPRHTLSVGGRLGYSDDGETPNTQVIVHDYSSAPLIFEVRGLPSRSGGDKMDQYRGVSIGNIIDCEGGYLFTDKYFTASAHDKDGKVIKTFEGHDGHMANFIDVIRSRKTSDLFGQIEDGHVSSALCHLGNISHGIGRNLPPGELTERIRGNAGMAEANGRMMEHLAANGVDLKDTPLTLGASLTIGEGSEQFTGEMASQANPLLTRQYRAPFTVPDLTRG